MIPYVIRFVICTVALALLPGCSPFSSKKPPVVLVLVEGFSEKDFLCSDPRLIDGLEHLERECDNFLRFTHTFSPSILTQTSIASLLTGLPPQKHGVVDNGPLAISYQQTTLAESALEAGMRTALFSGGVPLLSKFGVGQGYELFNDSFSLKNNPDFRPFHKTLKRSFRWMDEEVRGSSFFVTYYVPDLLYTSLVTKDNFGDERPIDRASQLREFYESINQLIGGLAQRKKINNTHLIILGLKGESTSLLPLSPIGSDLLQVPLQIKMAENSPSNLQNLTTNLLSFDRLGRWLHELISYKPSQGALEFKTGGARSIIPQMSHWHSWLELANWSHLGLRKKRYVFTFHPNFDAFDSFVDKDEKRPISDAEKRALYSEHQIATVMKNFFPKECYPVYNETGSVEMSQSHCKEPEIKKRTIKSLEQITTWSNRIDDFRSVDFNSWIEKAKKSGGDIVPEWLAYQLLVRKNWTGLFELGRHQKNKAWMLIAQSNLRESSDVGRSGCLKYFVGERHSINDFYKNCQSSGLRKVIEGLSQLKQKRRPSSSFWNEVSSIKRRRRAKNVNLKLQLMNDVDHSFDFGPTLAELYFHLPDNISFLNLIEADKT